MLEDPISVSLLKERVRVRIHFYLPSEEYKEEVLLSNLKKELKEILE